MIYIYSIQLDTMEHREEEISSSNIQFASHENASLLKSADDNESHGSQNSSASGSSLTYVSFLLFGLCTVFPWNVFITAKPYFDNKLNETGPNGTANNDDVLHYQAMLEVFFSIGSQVTSLIMQFVTATLINRITLDVRMNLPLAGMLVIFLITAVLTWVPVFSWLEAFYYFTIATVICISVCAAIFQSSTFGAAGVFPKKIIHATMIGQGLGGVFVSIFEIFVLVVLDNYIVSGFIYFIFAVLVILATIFSYMMMKHQPYARDFINEIKLEDSTHVERIPKTPPFLKIFKQIWLPALSVCLTFGVTLGNFPSITTSIHSYSHRDVWREKFFTPVVCFLFFNVWDCIGRMSSAIQIPSEKYMPVIAILVLSRFSFYPLFAFCNVLPRQYTLTYFTDDIYPMIFMTIFAFSNGYLGSLCVMYGPKMVSAEHQEAAGAMISFFLVLGLALGSISSLIVPIVI